MRECFVNVYQGGVVGEPMKTRQRAAWYRTLGGRTKTCIVRVRLKPEGAPKRYASEANRRAWDLMPDAARRVSKDGMILCYYGTDEDADFWASQC